jgi:putative transposase
MSVTSLITPLQAGRYYHVYNRGNNKERLFHFKGNYDFFLEKYFFYLEPIVQTYSYCLLPNHFHFLLRVRENEMNPKKVSNQLRKLFICYARHINIQEKRSGCLLSKNFRRVEINHEDYLRRLVLYIHYNPVKHGIVNDFTNYPYSTFSLILLNQFSRFEKKEVIDWFGGIDNFLDYHRIRNDDSRLKKMIIDD